MKIINEDMHQTAKYLQHLQQNTKTINMGQQGKIFPLPFLRLMPITKYTQYSQEYLSRSIHINIKLDPIKMAPQKEVCLGTLWCILIW